MIDSKAWFELVFPVAAGLGLFARTVVLEGVSLEKQLDGFVFGRGIEISHQNDWGVLSFTFFDSAEDKFGGTDAGRLADVVPVGIENVDSLSIFMLEVYPSANAGIAISPGFTTREGGGVRQPKRSLFCL